MAVSWTTITNAQVAAGAPLTTSLVTALRDNPEGIAQRASGALKAFNVPYNYQEFTSPSGTWTKPTDAETGDEVFVEICAGGEAGDGANGGGAGGSGLIARFDIDDLGATEAVVVGVGGASGGANGGDSSFGTAPSDVYRAAAGGAGLNGGDPAIQIGYATDITASAGSGIQVHGGRGDTGGVSNVPVADQNTIYGGGGGGGRANNQGGGNSAYHGRGGRGNNAGNGISGEFPGGGGGSGSTGDGSGGDGIVRVYCIKRN